ncbi:hypothetical protein DXO206_023035 (plasmid) [Xanthomonas oryzae pv. oryzae]|uniref:hypothetical protein n=1 Tax=Xanthomonas oryzae TaxID=347 RepID=UPI00094A056F|nr:hypothetical protein DXO206_023035 [Xanthomonas oryzae pv. oryzae]
MKQLMRPSEPDAIEKLEAEIERLKASQKMIRTANTALRKGDDNALRALGFSEEHIAELKKQDFAGRGGSARQDAAESPPCPRNGAGGLLR